MKNDVIENIRLEIEKPKTKKSISVRQGDTKTRTIHITIAKNGCVVELEHAEMAVIYITKPDGKTCYNNCVISGNELWYTLTTQTINVLGECKCQIEVTFDDGAVITSPEFIIFVYEKLGNRADIMSQNEYTALTEQVVKAREYAEQTSDGVKKVENMADEVASMKEEAEGAAVEAKSSEEAAKVSEANAKNSEEIAKEKEAKILEYSEKASTAEKNSKLSETNAEKYASAAAVSEANAKTYSDSAGTSREYAQQAETSSAASAEAAKTSEANAKVAEAGAKAAYEQFKEEAVTTLGTGHSNAFYGDFGQAAYEHSKKTSGNPHKVTYLEAGADPAGEAQKAYRNAVSYTDEKIADLINGAPETLDTLKEIADAMLENDEVVNALNEAVGKKANEAEFASHETNEVIHITESERTSWSSFEKRIDDLEDKIGYPV